MKIATNTMPVEEFGYQLVLDGKRRILSINILFEHKILMKNRLKIPVVIENQLEINELVKVSIMELLSKGIKTSETKTKEAKSGFYNNVMSSK